jgi:glycosyltransferase involved in cell wall biosynthesis
LVTTDVGGLNDICIDDVNGMKVRADQVEDLVNAIEYAYLNREEVERWSKNALEISKCFSKEKWDARWEAIIDAFIGE